MNATWRRRGLWLALSIAALAAVLAAVPRVREASFWLRQTSPGPLTRGHAFLETQCSACHVTLRSVPAAQCIVCHANNTALLQRQATAFHASVGACTACHREHEGAAGAVPRMDHAALADIGLRQLKASAADSEALVRNQALLTWMNNNPEGASANQHLTAAEAALDCSGCHATKDRHRGLLGKDCAQCHAVTQWTLPDFRHPPPDSLDCAQCHQAPPSHYMEHFRMISMRIAGQEQAEVRQCYLCHQTTAWNDIRGVGFYKHH